MVEWKKLGEVCSFFRGRSLSKKDIGEGNHQILLYGELYTTYGDYITHIKSKTSFEKAIVATKLKYNDLVLPVSSTTKEAQIGKVSVIKTKSDVYLGSDAILLRDTFNPAYLMYYLNSTLFEKSKMECVHGTTIMHLSPTELAQKEIPIPSLSEQSRIVSILDTFTSSISNLKQQIEERRKQYEYERDLLLDLEGKEGVEMKKLGEICEIKNGYTPSTKKPEFWENGSIPWFTLEDIRKNGRILSDAIKHITPTGVKKSGLFPQNSIIVSTTATIGEYALITRDFLCNQQISCISVKEATRGKLLPKYLYYLSNSIGNWCKKNVNGGGSLLIVSTSKLNNLFIPLPPLSTQSRIVSILDTFEQSISNLEEQLAMREKQYEYYRNQLLTFEGEEERGKT